MKQRLISKHYETIIHHAYSCHTVCLPPHAYARPPPLFSPAGADSSMHSGTSLGRIVNASYEAEGHSTTQKPQKGKTDCRCSPLRSDSAHHKGGAAPNGLPRAEQARKLSKSHLSATRVRLSGANPIVSSTCDKPRNQFMTRMGHSPRRADRYLLCVEISTLAKPVFRRVVAKNEADAEGQAEGSHLGWIFV